MRKFFAVLFLLSGTVLLPQESMAQCRPMKVIMEDMRTNFRFAGRFFQDAARSAEVVQSADNLRALALEAVGCPPASAANDLARFQAMLNQVAETALQFRAAIQAQDFRRAGELLRSLDQQRRDGHSIFD